MVRWDYTNKATTYLGNADEMADVPDVVEGETFYACDEKKCYVYYDGEWVEM